jgi:hypothetical protein
VAIVNDDGIFETQMEAAQIDWSKLNQPTGEVKVPDVGDSPVQRQVDDFKKRAAEPVVPLKDLTDEDTNTAINVALGTGPGLIASVRAKTIDKGLLYLAQEAEQQGFSAQEIFKSTGYFKGADKAWRFEIDDSAAKFFPENLKGTKYLTDVLSHKELFDAYPELTHVKIRENTSLGAGAQFVEGNKLIELGPGALKDKGILVHEIQHAIQGVEGLSKGGMPGRVGRDYNLKYEADVNSLRPEFIKLQNKALEEGSALTTKEQSRLDYLREVFFKYVAYTRGGDKQARENYEALAGEVEARNAQHRVDLTPEERMRFNPIDTEDVVRSKQFVRPESSLTTPYVINHPYDGRPDFHTY